MNSRLPKHHKFAPGGRIGTPVLFDWATVANGKRHRLVRGKDFDCDPTRLERSLNYWAKKNKAKASIEILPRHVIVRINRGRRVVAREH
jgi:hypothetical protein